MKTKQLNEKCSLCYLKTKHKFPIHCYCSYLKSSMLITKTQEGTSDKIEGLEEIYFFS